MKPTNRTILITGGSSGIGLETARQLLARGNVVIVTGRDRARLDQAATQLPGLHTIRRMPPIRTRSAPFMRS